jgi:hypothetical protein
LGQFKGNEIVTGDMISCPISEWNCINSNSKHYKVIYRAENHKKALEILETWKNESLTSETV